MSNLSKRFVIVFSIFAFVGLTAFYTHTALAKPANGSDCLKCHANDKKEQDDNLKKKKPQNNTKKVKGPHTAFFLSNHGTEVVNKGNASCIKCHKSINFCSECHRKKIRPKTWDQQHASLKKYTEKTSCAQCHKWAKK